MTRPLAVDTSVAIPLLVRTHDRHDEVVEQWAGRELALSGHAAIETYAVLTRLPGDLRLATGDTVRLLDARFAEPYLLPEAAARELPRTLARLGVAGGAVYDAVVALAAVAHDAVLATRDARALATYRAVGVQVEVLAS